ncbi:MAG: beta-propeller fold lactonase family protein, partial [Herbiconiux sp.]|nr:beta-propeller fold lactonase family protein [Herbiconiux sp.]
MTPRTFPRLLRQAAAALALAALLATAGVASSASALSTSTLIITKLAEASIDTTVGTSDMAIDSQAGRGYIANYTRNSVDVFDVSGATLRRIATIVTGLVNPRSIAVDSVNHRVYVAERNSRAIKVVDGDPTSATVNQVTSTIATTAQPRTMAVDTTNGRLFVGSEFAETIDLIDLRDGSLSKIPINATTAGQGKPMTIDPSTSTVFVGLSTDPLITVIKSDLSRTEGSITSGTDQMQFVGGALIAAQSTMAGMALMKFDPETLAAAATSPLLQSNTGI